MAEFKASKPPKPLEVSNWKGVNESVGNTEINVAESVLQENYRVTKNGKLDKRPGHWVFVNCPSPIRGRWYGVIGGEKVLLFATGGNLYRYNLALEGIEIDLNDLLSAVWRDSEVWDDSEIWDESANPTVSLIGAIADVKLQMLWFNNAVYIKGQGVFKTYDGTTYADAVPYEPTITIGTPPSGGGTLFEEVNLLTGVKKQSFTANGTDTIYTLAEKALDTNYTPIITINGVATVAFTTNFTDGKITFTTAPVLNAIVLIKYRKTIAGQVDLVLNHVYMTDYGVENDTNLFFFGGTHEKSTIRYSMVGNPTYFTASGFVNVSSTQFAVTDLISQYQRLLVFKEDGTFILKPTPNQLYETNTGLNPYNYGYVDLNESVGNVAPNMVQLIENNPVSLYGSSMWLWSSETSVEDERNAKIISDRLKLSLQDIDLKTAITFDYQDEKEYWVCVGSKVYIWNYGNNTMYTYTNIQANDFFLVDGNLCFISGNKINRFKREYVADGSLLGNTIPCVMYSGFSDMGLLESRKMMRNEWVSLAPAAKSSLDIKFATDKRVEADSKTYTIKYRFMDFNNFDFNDVSFFSNGNPQPKRLKAKVKKFTYLQYILSNNTNDETCTVLKVLFEAQVQGPSR